MEDKYVVVHEYHLDDSRGHTRTDYGVASSLLPWPAVENQLAYCQAMQADGHRGSEGRYFIARVTEAPVMDAVDAAIETVARHAMASMVEVICDCWESYPEVAKLDWERVAERVATLAPYPPAADFQAAYKLLAGRADDE